MQIRQKVFRGTKPRVSPQLLDPSQAQVARNCDLQFGDLRPISGVSTVATLSVFGQLRSLFKSGGTWLAWPSLVDVIFSPTYNKLRRFCFTGDGEPKKSDSSMAGDGADTMSSYGLGVPAPVLPLTVSIDPASSTADTLRSTSYVYTYVTTWGEESAPSSETAVFEVKSDQTVSVSTNAFPPDGYNIAFWRLYRIAVGTKNAEFQFVDEISVSDTSYQDSKSDSDLGAILETSDYTAPVSPWSANAFYYTGQRAVSEGTVYRCIKNVTKLPAENPSIDTASWEISDGLSGLTALSNGVLAAFDSNELYMSMPYIPYAWPLSYNLTAEYPIVSLGHYSNTLVVLTQGWPYLSDGLNPSAAGLTKIDSMQPCINRRGVVSGSNFVLYPSPDGLVSLGENGLSVLTSDVLTKKQWSDLQPDKFISFWYDGKYICFIEGSNLGYIINLNNGITIETITLDTSLRVWGGYIDIESDGLFLLCDRGDLTYTVERYDAGTQLQYTWKSKPFSVPQYTAISAARVKGDFSSGVTFTFFGDGAQVHQATISDSKPFRLPAGRWRTLEYAVSGTDRVEEIALATSVGELMQLDSEATQTLG